MTAVTILALIFMAGTGLVKCGKKAADRTVLPRGNGEGDAPLAPDSVCLEDLAYNEAATSDQKSDDETVYIDVDCPSNPYDCDATMRMPLPVFYV
jgi:hypothetical protein